MSFGFLLIVLLLGLYIFFVGLTWFSIVGDTSHRTYSMNWVNRGTKNNFNQPEIFLEYVDYPGFHEGIYSEELADYLNTLATNQVDVKFEVTSNFGCVRSFYEVQIGNLTPVPSRWGYSGRTMSRLRGKIPGGVCGREPKNTIVSTQ